MAIPPPLKPRSEVNIYEVGILPQQEHEVNTCKILKINLIIT